MRRPISFTFIVTICSLMNIIALMPVTKAYEVLLRNWGGPINARCCVWQEDYQHQFITYIPPTVLPIIHHAYYCFNCQTFDGMDQHGADLRNGVLTYKTLDDTTTYWVDLEVTVDFNQDQYSTNTGGYNNHTCFHVGAYERADLTEAPYEECQQIRDSK